jgi:hypothetical protein
VFYFVLIVVGVSILVSLFGTWIKLIPRYPNRKYTLIQRLTNTGLLTVLLTLMLSFGVYPSWQLLFAIVLFVLWLSVRLTNDIVRKRGESAVETAEEDRKTKGTH